MALSRIWAAFILISIAVAGFRYAFIPADKEILSSMVIGKAGDTLRLSAPQPGAVNSSPLPATPAPSAKPAPSPYVIQHADGLLETCRNAVTLAFGLIGIMAVFMGLVSIAEQAGGIRFLSRITAPFFSRLFPDLPKGHPAMGHMVMNFSANLLGLDNAATPLRSRQWKASRK